MSEGRRDRRSGNSLEDPPNSRLFIVAPKCLIEDDFRRAFEDFGDIEEVWVVKDKITGENKGVTYVKYSKTSSAAKALEVMNGKCIGGDRPMKVMIAASREQGSKRDQNEEEALQRLFVVVPKNMTNDAELYDYFKQFGDIDYATIIKDRNTRESKGVAYVKFTKFSSAATAFEECDRKYRPVFAEPRRSREERNFEMGGAPPINYPPPPPGPHHVMGGPPPPPPPPFMSSPPPPPPDHYRDEGFNKLVVIAGPMVNQDQMWKLFDIVPTMDYCQVQFKGDRSSSRPNRAIVEVVYENARWASYAKDKFHGFEYPPGYRLIVRPEYDQSGKRGRSSSESRPTPAPDILKIAETIAQATNLMKAAGLSPDLLNLNNSSEFCSVSLPEKQPLANPEEPMKARCFVVCSPSALPSSILKDVFSRFGDLIDVYLLSKKNCGYAKFASENSALEAINVLNGAQVYGMKLTVVKAEERNDNKRQKIEEDN